MQGKMGVLKKRLGNMGFDWFEPAHQGLENVV